VAGVAYVLQEEARLNELGSGGACPTRTAAGLEKIKKNTRFLFFRWQRARIFWFLLGFISVCFGEGKGHSFMVDFPRKEL